MLENIRFRIPQALTWWVDDQAIDSTASSAQLQAAIFNGELARIEGIVSSNKDLLKTPLPDGELPLHAAVRLGRRDVVQLLLVSGADITQRDFQGLSALDYSAAKKDHEMVRILLPSQVVRQIDDAQSRILSIDNPNITSINDLLKNIQIENFSNIDPVIMEAIRKGDLNAINQYINNEQPIQADQLSLAIIIGNREIVDALLSTAKPTDFIQCNAHGISPLHIAAALKDEKSLRIMVARGGDLFQTNEQDISAADILFNGNENDPLKLPKTQLLLGLLSLGGILAHSYILPLASQDTASLWSAGLLLINTGVDLALSYNAYAQLNPENVWEKVLYWATTFATLPVHAMMQSLPEAKIVWDAWRMYTVCKGAWNQIKCAYHNFSYDKIRSTQLVGIQLLTVGTSAYHARESFQKVVQACKEIRSVDNTIYSRRIEENELESTRLELQRKTSLFETEKSKAENELESTRLELQRKTSLFETEKSKAENELKSTRLELQRKTSLFEIEKRNLEREQTNFEALKSDWDAKTKEESICKKLLRDEIKTQTNQAKKAWISKLTDPHLPYLAGSTSTKPTESEIYCALLADKISNNQIILPNDKDLNKIPKTLLFKHHQDKCPPGLETVCLKANQQLLLYKNALNALKGKRRYKEGAKLTCTPPPVVVAKEIVKEVVKEVIKEVPVPCEDMTLAKIVWARIW